MAQNDLVKLLKSKNVPLGTWGKGGALSVESLHQEVEAGLSVVSAEKQTVVRKLRDISLDVFTGTPGSPERHLLPVAGSNGLQQGESTFDTRILYRAESKADRIKFVHDFLQSIGVFESAQIVEHDPTSPQLLNSKLYPGLKNHKTAHRYSVFITESVYVAAGYPGKKNISYLWRDVPKSVARPVVVPQSVDSFLEAKSGTSLQEARASV